MRWRHQRRRSGGVIGWRGRTYRTWGLVVLEEGAWAGSHVFDPGHRLWWTVGVGLGLVAGGVVWRRPRPHIDWARIVARWYPDGAPFDGY